MSFISTLKFHNFRCYQRAALDNISGGLIVFYGPNGAGKTNILEAVSLLSPGRGLRTAKTMEIQCQNAPQGWAVSAEINRGMAQSIQIGTGIDPVKQNKRLIRINGENVKSQAALADFIACVWLTPQMDRLFIDSSGHRRRFLDRLVFAFDPGHAGRVSRYENALSQRSKLLREGRADPKWLDALESQAAETGVAIAAARLEFVHKLQSACDAAESAHFPKAHLIAKGHIEELLQTAPALEIEHIFAHQLKSSRERDSITGGAATGPHKSDLEVIYAAKDMPADQCSTGEQKALLIGIILAHAHLIKAERGAPPVLLLDEIAAHLDEGRRTALYETLINAGGQVWLTGTDENLFTPIRETAQFFRVENATITHNVILSEAPKARSRRI